MGVSGQRDAPAALYPQGKNPGTHWIGGWVGLRASLDTGDRRKILRPCRGSNPNRPVRSQTLYCLSYRGSSLATLYRTKLHHNSTKSLKVTRHDMTMVERSFEQT
jgi:hypothetical protein